jgi:phosphoglycolate phosphatase
MGKNLSLIFDLDGCLIDSSEVQKAAFFGSYEEIVGDDNCPSYEEYIKQTGNSVDGMLKNLGLPAEMADPFRRISCEAIDKIKVNWEAMELIKDLRNQGCKIALCTGKDHYRTVDILKYYHVDDLFDILVCADDVTEPKPSAVPILEVIKCLGCKKDDVIMIGDGYNDVLSAKNAGVKSILTLWYGDFGVPREADTTVSNVSELSYIICEVKKK